MNRAMRIGYSVCALGATLAVGVAIGASGSKAGAAAPRPTVTVTKAVPGPTVTDNVPGPTITVHAKPAHASATMPGDGTFLVGYKAGEWKPGTWQSGIPGSGNCYWETDSDLTGGINSIIANNNSSGPSVITVTLAAKAVQVQGCATWHRI